MGCDIISFESVQKFNSKEAIMDSLFVILGWASPLGLGIFLALLGTFSWMLARADETRARSKALKKEKGLGKK